MRSESSHPDKNSLVLLSAAIALISRSKENDINPEEPLVSCDIIEVSGTISKPTVWQTGFVYIINGSDLRITSTLTLEPGVIVKIKDARIEVANGKTFSTNSSTTTRHIVFKQLVP